MTTQTANITLGNNQMSKVFTATVTDGSWTNLQDSLSSSNLGILIPNAMINRAVGDYAEALGAWRIINAQTLAVSRRGWLAKSGYNCYSTGAIPPHRVMPNEIVQAYTLPLDTTGNQSNVLAWVHTTKGSELYEAKDVVDATATEIKTALQDQTLGDAGFNSTLTGLSFQVEDGGQLLMVQIFDSAGGIVWSQTGNFRMPSAGATSAYYNFDAKGLGIPIGKGFTMKVTVKSA
jgi:hypothetical protein